MILDFLRVLKKIYGEMPSKFWGRAADYCWHGTSGLIGGTTATAALFPMHPSVSLAFSVTGYSLAAVVGMMGSVFKCFQKYKLEDENENVNKN